MTPPPTCGRSSCARAKPSVSGRTTSRKTRSGRSRPAASSASAPASYSADTRRSGSSSRSCRRWRRARTSGSTRRDRNGRASGGAGVGEPLGGTAHPPPETRRACPSPSVRYIVRVCSAAAAVAAFRDIWTRPAVKPTALCIGGRTIPFQGHRRHHPARQKPEPVVHDIATRLRVALGDRYLIEEEIGRGGAATVYLAEDVKHARKVAIKVLRPDTLHGYEPQRF